MFTYKSQLIKRHYLRVELTHPLGEKEVVYTHFDDVIIHPKFLITDAQQTVADEVFFFNPVTGPIVQAKVERTSNNIFVRSELNPNVGALIGWTTTVIDPESSTQLEYVLFQPHEDISVDTSDVSQLPSVYAIEIGASVYYRDWEDGDQWKVVKVPAERIEQVRYHEEVGEFREHAGDFLLDRTTFSDRLAFVRTSPILGNWNSGTSVYGVEEVPVIYIEFMEDEECPDGGTVTNECCEDSVTNTTMESIASLHRAQIVMNLIDTNQENKTVNGLAKLEYIRKHSDELGLDNEEVLRLSIGKDIVSNTVNSVTKEKEDKPEAIGGNYNRNKNKNRFV